MQVRAGEVLKTKICMDRIMIEESKKLCAAFKPCGPMTVQLIRDKDDVDWFIEINPRYGGGAPLSMKAGARSAETVLKLLEDETVDREQQISDGAIYSRFDQSVCIEEGCNFKIKGIIFDLDDTLYSEKEYVRSGFHAVSEYLGGGHEDKLWQYFEDGKPAIDALVKEIGLADKKQKCLEIYRNHKPDIQPYPGVREMFEELKHKGIKVGVITDGRPEGQRNKLEALGISENFIITDELGGVQFRKPCDMAFRIMSMRWQFDPSEIIYVGDNPSKDFQGPRQIGMKSIWFNNQDGLYYFLDMIKMPQVVSIKELRNELLRAIATNDI